MVNLFLNDGMRMGSEVFAMRKREVNETAIRNTKGWPDYQNNTNISLVNRYIYFAVDKVANSTVKQILFDEEYSAVNWETKTLYDPRCSPLLSPYQLPYNPEELFISERMFKFAFVRNPYSRILSCYLDRILTLSSRPSRQFRRRLNKEEFEFEDFVNLICSQEPREQNSHWRVQYDDILFEFVDFDFVGKFESLEEDLSLVYSRIFGKPLSKFSLEGNYSPKRTSASEKVKRFYTQRMLDKVYDAYRKDFEAFGYDKVIL